MWGSLNKPGAHGENVGNGRDLQRQTSGGELTAAQRSEAEQQAVEFLKKVVRVPGVRISRDDFLRQELRERGVPEEVIRRAIDTNPAFAGIPLAELDRLAEQVISYETNKSAAISFAAGIPGGFAMLGTIPADLTQYYVHAFRIVQKLAYLYGWRELLRAKEDVDDETIGVIAIFFGVMLDVENAAMSLASFASSTVMNTVKKQVTKQLLVKTSWYRAVKKTLRSIGVNLTKKAFNQGFSKVLPVIGGVVSSGLTFMSLQSQSSRLKKHLRELPPPGIDSEMWKQVLAAADSVEHEQSFLAATDAAFQGRVGVAAVGVVSAASGVTSGVRGIFGRRK
ncbi:hypothetical protein O3684_01840 [Pauljensenia sp. 20925_1_27]